MAGQIYSFGGLIAKKITHIHGSEYMCPFCHDLNRMHVKRCKCDANKKIRAKLKYSYKKASGKGIPDTQSSEDLLDHLRELHRKGEF